MQITTYNKYPKLDSHEYNPVFKRDGAVIQPKKKQSESKVITFFVKAKQGPGKQRRPRLHHFQSATSRVFMNEEKLKQDLKFRFQFI